MSWDSSRDFVWTTIKISVLEYRFWGAIIDLLFDKLNESINWFETILSIRVEKNSVLATLTVKFFLSKDGWSQPLHDKSPFGVVWWNQNKPLCKEKHLKLSWVMSKAFEAIMKRSWNASTTLSKRALTFKYCNVRFVICTSDKLSAS